MPQLSNPTLPQIPDTFSPVEAVPSYNGEVVGEAVTALAQTASDVVDSARLANYSAEIDEQDAAYVASLSEQQKVIDQGLAQIQSSEGTALQKQLDKIHLLSSQTKADPSVVAVLKETAFRKWAAQFPGLTPEFLKIANASGMGTNGISEGVKYATGLFNEQFDPSGALADAKTQVDEITKVGISKGMLPEDPQFNGSFDQYANAVFKQTNFDRNYENDLKVEHRTDRQRANVQRDYDDGIARVVADNQQSLYGRVSAALLNGMRSFKNSLDTMAQADQGALSAQREQQLYDMGMQQVVAIQKELAGMTPSGATVNWDFIVKQTQPLADMVLRASKSQSIEQLQAGLNFNKAARETIGNRGVFPDPVQEAWASYLAKAAAVSPGAATLLDKLSATKATEYQQHVAEMTLQATGVNQAGLNSTVKEDGVTFNPQTGNTIDDRATKPGSSINKVWTQLVQQDIPAMRQAVGSENPTIQTQGLMQAATYAEALALYYEGGEHKAPPIEVIDGLWKVFQAPGIRDLITEGFDNPVVYDKLQKGIFFVVEAETNDIMKDVRKAAIEASGITVGERPLTLEERTSPAFIKLYASNPSALDAIKIPVSALEGMHLEIDSDYNVSFHTTKTIPGGNEASTNLTKKYGGRLSTLMKGTAPWFNGAPEVMLRGIENNSGFPPEFRVQYTDETK